MTGVLIRRQVGYHICTSHKVGKLSWVLLRRQVSYHICTSHKVGKLLWGQKEVSYHWCTPRKAGRLSVVCFLEIYAILDVMPLYTKKQWMTIHHSYLSL